MSAPVESKSEGCTIATGYLAVGSSLHVSSIITEPSTDRALRSSSTASTAPSPSFVRNGMMRSLSLTIVTLSIKCEPFVFFWNRTLVLSSPSVGVCTHILIADATA